MEWAPAKNLPALPTAFQSCESNESMGRRFAVVNPTDLISLDSATRREKQVYFVVLVVPSWFNSALWY